MHAITAGVQITSDYASASGSHAVFVLWESMFRIASIIWFLLLTFLQLPRTGLENLSGSFDAASSLRVDNYAAGLRADTA